MSEAPPTTAQAPLNKGEKPRPDRGSDSSKEKANFNTYHCCSKSQSLKKSNRSIAAGRRRLAAVCPCSLRVGAALSCAAVWLRSAARLSGPPARLKVLGPHWRQRGGPGYLVLRSGAVAAAAAEAMAPGRQEPDRPLWSTRSAAARVPRASGLRWRPLGAGAGWAARLAGCGRVATAEAGASEALAVARRGSRGGSGGGGGCTGGGGGRDSITHLHTHRGRSLDSSKPRHGADTLSSLDLAGLAPPACAPGCPPPPVKIS